MLLAFRTLCDSNNYRKVAVSDALPTDAARPAIHARFFPHCMECRRDLAMRILSVRPYVHPSVRPFVCLSACQTREF